MSLWYAHDCHAAREELNESAAFAARYAGHGEARKTRDQAQELYGTQEAEGIVAAKSYSFRFLGARLDIDHELFWHEGLKVALGI